MAEPKTLPTQRSVAAYIDALPDAQQRADCRALVTLMRRVTGAEPVMWGPSIVGFGSYRYVYASGRSGDWPLTGFAPRGGALSVYVMDGFEQRAALLARLGPHKTGKSCLYVKSLAGLDRALLESLLVDSVRVMRARYPQGAAAAPPVAPRAKAATRAQPASTPATAASTSKAAPAQRGGASARAPRSAAAAANKAARAPTAKPTRAKSTMANSTKPSSAKTKSTTSKSVNPKSAKAKSTKAKSTKASATATPAASTTAHPARTARAAAGRAARR